MQTVILEDNIYLLLFLGMIAVGAHAYSLFNQRIDGNETSARWRFLATVPIQLVTKKSNFNLGFIVYLSLFELVYIILASSGSLVLMLYQISGREEMTGALSENVKPNGAVPILASTAIILLTQVKPFSSFELMLRSATHRIAAIPDGLRSVKQNITQRIRKYPMVFPDPGNALELTPGSEQRAELVEEENIRENGVKRSQQKKKIDAWIKSELAPEEASEFTKAYWNTLWLNEYTLETLGEQTWDAEESEEILRLFQSTEHEVAQFRSALESAAEKGNSQSDNTGFSGEANKQEMEKNADKPEGEPIDQADISRWKNDKKKCAELEERLILLLSLLIINQPDVQTDNKQLINIIDSAYERQQSKIANITLSSALKGGLILLVTFTIYYWGESMLKQQIRQDPYSSKAPFGEFVEQQIQNNTEDAKIYKWSGMLLSERQEEDERSSLWFNSLSGDLNNAAQEVILILLIFVSSVPFALSTRAHYKRLREWNLSVKSNKSIFLVSKYYVTCTSAMIFSLVTIFMYFFVTLWLLPAIVNNRDLLSIDAIEEFIPFAQLVPLTALIAWVCAYFALHISDTIPPEVDHFPSLIRIFGVSIYFGLLCALVAFIGDLYGNNLHSIWNTTSTLFLNFSGFTILFVCFIRAYMVYVKAEMDLQMQMDNEEEQSVSVNEQDDETVSGDIQESQQQGDRDEFQRNASSDGLRAPGLNQEDVTA